ncbi:MAG: hypothetical protein QME60_01365 [Verrucomicrobiota bacterium]|nr:hypothetical protein [Verrucomicrobiota bacterium]
MPKFAVAEKRPKSAVAPNASEPGPAPAVAEIANAAPKTMGLHDEIKQLRSDLILIANEIGLRLGEPLKSNFAYILERHEAPGSRRK